MAIVKAGTVKKETPYDGLTKESSNDERLNAVFKDLFTSAYPVYIDLHKLGMRNFNNEQAIFEASLMETGFVKLEDNPTEQNKFKLKPNGFAMLTKHGSYLNYLHSKKHIAEEPSYFTFKVDKNVTDKIKEINSLLDLHTPSTKENVYDQETASYMEEVSRRGVNHLQEKYPQTHPIDSTNKNNNVNLTKFASKTIFWIATNIGKFIFYVGVALAATYFAILFKLYPH